MMELAKAVERPAAKLSDRAPELLVLLLLVVAFLVALDRFVQLGTAALDRNTSVLSRLEERLR